MLAAVRLTGGGHYGLPPISGGMAVALNEKMAVGISEGRE